MREAIENAWLGRHQNKATAFGAIKAAGIAEGRSAAFAEIGRMFNEAARLCATRK
jgi:hypothetical protein